MIEILNGVVPTFLSEADGLPPNESVETVPFSFDEGVARAAELSIKPSLFSDEIEDGGREWRSVCSDSFRRDGLVDGGLYTNS